MANKIVTANTYLVLVPDIRGSGNYKYVSSIRVDRTRKDKPSLKSGEIAIKLNLQFNESQLIDSIPSLTVDVTNYAVGQPTANAVEVVEIGVDS